MANGPYFDKGRYWGKLTKQAIGSAKTGTPQAILVFDIMGAVDPRNPSGDLIPCPSGHGTLFLSLTTNTIDWVLPILRELGLKGDKISVLDESMPDHQSLLGVETSLYCDHKTGQDGVLRESWSIAKESTGPKVEPLDKAGLRKLDAMFGRQLKATSNGTKPAPKADAYSEPDLRTAPEVEEEDSIPF